MTLIHRQTLSPFYCFIAGDYLCASLLLIKENQSQVPNMQVCVCVGHNDHESGLSRVGGGRALVGRASRSHTTSWHLFISNYGFLFSIHTFLGVTYFHPYSNQIHALRTHTSLYLFPTRPELYFCYPNPTPTIFQNIRVQGFSQQAVAQQTASNLLQSSSNSVVFQLPRHEIICS